MTDISKSSDLLPGDVIKFKPLMATHVRNKPNGTIIDNIDINVTHLITIIANSARTSIEYFVLSSSGHVGWILILQDEIKHLLRSEQ